MQVLGGVLFCLGAMTALLAGTIGFELDGFYVVVSIIGVGLFLYGAIQKNSISRQASPDGAKSLNAWRLTISSSKENR